MNKFDPEKAPSSFRDPSGFIFKKNGEIYRQVNISYKENYDLLIGSGLHAELVSKKYLIDQKEIGDSGISESAYKILKPIEIPFISYPYEWSFSALKDAALATLEIQKIALSFGMSLKDASAYNIQFLDSKPIFIDTLSFEKYKDDKPWVAYRQFCQHFLAPLALMSYTDLRLGILLQNYLDGIPLDLAVKLLPTKAKFSLGLGTHIFLHAKSQQSHAGTALKSTDLKLPKNQLLGIIENLKSTISGLKLPNQRTTWDNYYNNTNYSDNGFQSKEKIILKWIAKIKPKSLWDAGANDAYFSRLASKQNIETIATDFDPVAIEHAYLRAKDENDCFLLPLIIDLTDPSPSIGWQNLERDSFLKRSSFDLALCLALVHHLAIANNLPLSHIAKLFSDHTKYLIIEFVPKGDSNTERLLDNREDIFVNYDQASFEKEFSKYFKIIEQLPVEESKRTLYLMEREINA